MHEAQVLPYLNARRECEKNFLGDADEACCGTRLSLKVGPPERACGCAPRAHMRYCEIRAKTARYCEIRLNRETTPF